MNDDNGTTPRSGDADRRIGPRPRRTTLLHAATTLLGLVMVLTPLALWVAWSETMLLAVAAVGAVATLALLLVRRLTDRDGGTADGAARRHARPPEVPDAFLKELSGMGPFTYHNRLTGDRKFRLKMARLRKLLDRD